MDDEPLTFGRDRHVLVETLRQRRPHLDLGAADRVGIGQEFSGFETIKYIAHHDLATAG
jgi:hypothetical protein